MAFHRSQPRNLALDGEGIDSVVVAMALIFSPGALGNWPNVDREVPGRQVREILPAATLVTLPYDGFAGGS